MQRMLNRLRRRTAIFLHDLAMAPLAWLGAYWLRYNLEAIPVPEWSMALSALPFVLAIQAVVLRVFRFYRGVWSFASLLDLYRISKAVAASALLIAAGLFIYNRLDGVPRSVIPLYAILLLLLLGGPRFVYRFWKDRVGAPVSAPAGKRALVVGAGNAGEMLVRDLLLREHGAVFCPVAFVDDNPGKRGRAVHDLRVMGDCEKIPRLVESLNIDVILIATPSASDKEMRRIVGCCEKSGVPFLTLPSVTDVLTGRVTRESLRHVAIEDLLGRAPVRLDWEAMRRHLSGKTVFVSGGGGSIGSELCAQLARLPIAGLIVFEKSEFNLYRVASQLSRAYPQLPLVCLLGDIVDAPAVRHALAKHRPDIVFHAAAYKHVPLLEGQVREAMRNNLLGTRCLAEETVAAGIGEFVLISTDKAVRPTNVMGATKRAAELICQSLDGRGRTRFVTVRFGNVLDSAGSVVPLFRQQIQAGGPVTVTHPEVTRYFMTIPEASQLILEAAALGQGGEIFVLDMGEPVRIGYLAEQMIRLSGKKPDEDVRIEYIGLRPGEKLYEELFHEQEQLQPTPHDKLLLARANRREWTELESAFARVEQGCRDFDDAGLLAELRGLVPDYVPENGGVPA
ncbi:MAG TPA: nucleoside-diphosphate sugar epimerase/dehydratase [Methylococcaceae bacterium]|nr:nucleoside-diphosphate sugar epimerase/dehydratase [Methylococcaceae bacterium]